MVDLQKFASRILMSTMTGGARRLSILIYHRVLVERDWMLPDVPTVEEFRWQMQLMRRHFNMLSLAEAYRLMKEDKLPARAACITFDDGYADTAIVAHPVLMELEIPMTIFVASGYLDGGMMWNDILLESVRRMSTDHLNLQDFGLPCYSMSSHSERQLAAYDLVARCKYLDPLRRQEITSYLAQQSRALPSHMMMSHNEIRHLAEQGVEIGGHTVNHPILTKLTAAQAQSEIAEGKAHLEAITEQPVRLFAYPNGRPGVDYNDSHVRMVQKAGFEAAVTTGRGVSDHSTDLFQLPRFTPWAKSTSRFLLSMALNGRHASR